MGVLHKQVVYWYVRWCSAVYIGIFYTVHFACEHNLSAGDRDVPSWESNGLDFTLIFVAVPEKA